VPVCRGALTEKQVGKKHGLPHETWKKLGEDDTLVELIEAESTP
jgi:hypothetical protein